MWTISPIHYFLTSALSHCSFGHVSLHRHLNNSEEDWGTAWKNSFCRSGSNPDQNGWGLWSGALINWAIRASLFSFYSVKRGHSIVNKNVICPPWLHVQKNQISPSHAKIKAEIKIGGGIFISEFKFWIFYPPLLDVRGGGKGEISTENHEININEGRFFWNKEETFFNACLRNGGWLNGRPRRHF